MDRDTERIVTTHVLWAMGAGLIPVPIIDIAAVTAIQVDLLNALCRKHGVDFTTSGGKSLVAALTGTTVARLGASLIKAIPGLGSLIGGLSMSAMSGASTYAVGQVAARQLERNGTLFDMDPMWARRAYDQEFEAGKSVAKDLKNKEGAAKDVYESLAKLGELRDSGVLTEAEFQSKKEQLLDKLV